MWGRRSKCIHDPFYVFFFKGGREIRGRAEGKEERKLMKGFRGLFTGVGHFILEGTWGQRIVKGYFRKGAKIIESFLMMFVL